MNYSPYKRFQLILVCIVTLLLLPAAGNCFPLDTLYSEPLLDGDIVHYYDTGELYSSTYSSEVSVGDGLDWDFYAISTRAYPSFSLESLESHTSSPVSATLRVYQLVSTGDNHGGFFPSFFGDEYPCLIDHITYGDTLDPSDWTAGDSGDPNTLAARFDTISFSAEIGYREIDVLPLLINDLNFNRNRTQYRLSFEIEHDDDMQNDALVFSASTYPPEYFTPTLFVEYENPGNIWENRAGIQPTNHLISVYPNPSNSSVNIRFQASGFTSLRLEVYNIRGRLIFYEMLQIKTSISEINQISRELNVRSGLYFIGLRTPTSIDMQKLTIIN